jgi:lysophospholipase L1-like esterase
MQETTAVSRPVWVNAMNALTGTGGATRKSPVELIATAASVVTNSSYAEATGVRAGRLGRWTDGVAAMRGDRLTFAAYWHAHNDRVRRARASQPKDHRDPLWIVLGDSTAQGLGAPDPRGGYVGQTLSQLRRTTGRHWQVINLAVSGSLIRDVLAEQIPQLASANEDDRPDLVTCGTGVNDILFSAPAKLFADLRTLLNAVPDGTVLLDLPLPTGFWWIVGRMSVPYISRINRVIREVAEERSLPVAEVSAQFIAPWAGKFACDNFHPSQDGYRDWTRALLAAVPALTRRQGRKKQPPQRHNATKRRPPFADPPNRQHVTIDYRVYDGDY